jgi:hypothetical protein
VGRHVLAWFLREAGRVDEAIAELQTLIEDDLRVLGPDHHHTLRSRQALASWLDEVGSAQDEADDT